MSFFHPSFDLEQRWGKCLSRDRPKFGFGYGVSAEITLKYGFGLVSVTAKRNGRIAVLAET